MWMDEKIAPYSHAKYANMMRMAVLQASMRCLDEATESAPDMPLPRWAIAKHIDGALHACKCIDDWLESVEVKTAVLNPPEPEGTTVAK